MGTQSESAVAAASSAHDLRSVSALDDRPEREDRAAEPVSPWLESAAEERDRLWHTDYGWQEDW